MSKLKVYIGILTLLLSSSSIEAQSKVKPLEEVFLKIENAASAEEKCKIAMAESHSYFMYMKRDESLEVTKLGLKIAKKNNLNKYEIPLLIYMGRLYESFNSLDSAIHYADLARQRLSKDSEESTGKVYSFLGRHYQYFGELDSMLKYYTLAEEWNSKNEPYRNWVLYEQWHKLYIETGDFKKAEELLDKAYAITKPKAKRMDHGMLLYRYRMLADRIGDMDMFAKYSKEYYELVNENSTNGISAHGYDLGQHLTIKEKIKKYEALFTSNKRLAFDMGNKTYYPTIANLYLEDNQPQKAKKYWLKIDTIGQSLQTREDAESIGVRIFASLGDYTNAYHHLKKKNILNNQLQAKERLKQVDEFNVKYETLQKEKQVALLETQNELKNVELSKAKQSRYVLLFGLLVASLFALSLGYLYSQNNRKKRELEEKNRIIESALEDKNVLLREIHHRVKNNLQVVSSLLNLQSNYISDDAALEAINEGKNRVSSMALIHQNLYREENLTSINTIEYFDDLIDNLFDSYNIDEEKIKLTKTIDSLDIDVDTMIPLGLIVNELITNALKHAFKNTNHKGMIQVILKEDMDTLQLTIKDNGVGVSKELFLSSDSFGNKMIKAFLQKLKANIHVENMNGTSVSLSIKNYKRLAA